MLALFREGEAIHALQAGEEGAVVLDRTPFYGESGGQLGDSGRLQGGAAVVDVLSQLGVKFHGINILVDPDLRQGIKEFSQWPTIPQLYVKGEFVGGCDIIREMFETGELEQLMKEKGVGLATAA